MRLAAVLFLACISPHHGFVPTVPSFFHRSASAKLLGKDSLPSATSVLRSAGQQGQEEGSESFAKSLEPPATAPWAEGKGEKQERNAVVTLFEKAKKAALLGICVVQLRLFGNALPCNAADSGGRISATASPSSYGSAANRQGRSERATAAAHGTASTANILNYVGSGRKGITFESGRGARSRTLTTAEDPPSTSISPADIVMMTTVTGGVIAIQKHNRNKITAGSAPVISTLQLSFSLERDGRGRCLLDDLVSIASSADLSQNSGMRKVVRDVCLTMLRGEDMWEGAYGALRKFDSASEAVKSFDRATLRGQKKWNREVVSVQKGDTAKGGAKLRLPKPVRLESAAGMHTYAVVTLLVGFEGLADGGRKFLRDGAVYDRRTTKEFIEWISETAASQNNVRSIEVLWSPAEAGDNMSKDELITKWPSLTPVGF